MKAAYRLIRPIVRYPFVRKIALRFAKLKKGKLPIPSQDPIKLEGITESAFIDILQNTGFSGGLKIKQKPLEEIKHFADNNLAFANSHPKHGFYPHNKEKLERCINEEIQKSAYFHSRTLCDAIKEISLSPLLERIAKSYLGHAAKMTSTNLWWTYPANVDEETKSKNALFFHRDVDDFGFLKFFFYISNVTKNDGSHEYVLNSLNPSLKEIFFEEGLKIKRFDDEEIIQRYGKENIINIEGAAGSGFAEDTFGFHRGTEVNRNPRLILHVMYTYFDYEVNGDHYISLTDLEEYKL